MIPKRITIGNRVSVTCSMKQGKVVKQDCIVCTSVEATKKYYVIIRGSERVLIAKTIIKSEDTNKHLK